MNWRDPYGLCAKTGDDNVLSITAYDPSKWIGPWEPYMDTPEYTISQFLEMKRNLRGSSFEPSWGDLYRELNEKHPDYIGNKMEEGMLLAMGAGGASAIRTPANLAKNAGDLISGDLKRSSSFSSELANKSYKEILKLSQENGELAQKAKQMKKLIEQSPRLMENH